MDQPDPATKPPPTQAGVRLNQIRIALPVAIDEIPTQILNGDNDLHRPADTAAPRSHRPRNQPPRGHRPASHSGPEGDLP